MKFIVELQVGQVPPEVYKEKGKEEIAYTQALIHQSVVCELVVTRNRRHTWMIIETESEESLQVIIDGFPLIKYFTVAKHEVIDVAATVRNS